MTTLADVIVSEDELIVNPEEARREAAKSTPAQDPPAPAPEDADLPEKFRGKSRKDLVDMFQNLESSHGRIANELGTQRQLTDRLLDLKRNEDLQNNSGTRKAPPAPVTANDILDRPQETLERVVGAKTAEVSENVNQRLARMEANIAQAHFVSRHPDYLDVAQSAKFSDWVKASPIRMRAAAAANQGNWEIANELLSDFKGSQGGERKTDSTPPAPEADVAGARRAALETSGAAGGSDGKSQGGGEIFRRTALMKMRIEDPESYYDEDFQARVLKAHSEGRVR